MGPSKILGGGSRLPPPPPRITAHGSDPCSECRHLFRIHTNGKQPYCEQISFIPEFLSIVNWRILVICGYPFPLSVGVIYSACSFLLKCFSRFVGDAQYCYTANFLCSYLVYIYIYIHCTLFQTNEEIWAVKFMCMYMYVYVHVCIFF